ncbi:hypothetical protein GCK72_023392 [Caenorhabditis remanei]|uniref:Uncharacterized protein n=1 Tax=Caenorhabditis remanei TaxID=31234 RepID=A0A6A5FWS2_CAERE|nr:hypothetical protein GCK72_023392 [Caenorhabditis remanei]KAF1746934.1 hypothetical protein GCK72_023392 [Caenorhabditis remanei]
MAQNSASETRIYLLEQRKNKELNLEHIDEQMRMEQVRQSASKMEWTSFGQAVRRNLQEKRNTIDADGRKDVLKGIAFMKSRMPIETTFTMQEKVKIMAESLGCSHAQTSRGWSITKPEELNMDLTITEGQVTTVVLSFWEEPSFYSPEATKMLQSDQWTELRNKIAGMLSKYDRQIGRRDLANCKGALSMLEMLFSHFSQDASFIAVHRSNYGYYLRPSDLRNGRVYYLADPFYRSLRSKDRVYHLTEQDYDALPYFEVSFINYDSPCTLPDYYNSGEWVESIEADVAICMKLSRGVVMSEATRKKLGQFSKKTVSIRHYTNCYRYLTGEIKINNNLKMITQFTDGKAQHLYNVDVTSFNGEGDSVITEIFLEHMQDFHKVISILRNEAMHISLWESVLSSCYEQQGIKEHVVSAIRMNIFLSREEIVITFKTKYAPIKITIRDNANLETNVEVVNAETNLPIAKQIDETLTRKLNETWSIPVTLTYAVSGEDCKLAKIKVPLRAENPETKAPTPTAIIMRR